MLISSSFGRYIPKAILQRFWPSRKLNVHPSIVPQYRGPAPIQRAIADDLVTTGVSIIETEQVSKGYDAGDVWASREVAIPPQSTYQSLEPILAREGASLLVSVLRDMISGKIIIANPQDHSQATAAKAVGPESTIIDWSAWDAGKIERIHRAFGHQRPILAKLPWGPNLQLLEMYVAPLSSRDLIKAGHARFDRVTNSLRIRCISDTELAVTRVKQESRNTLNIKEWWNGVRPSYLEAGVLELSNVLCTQN